MFHRIVYAAVAAAGLWAAPLAAQDTTAPAKPAPDTAAAAAAPAPALQDTSTDVRPGMTEAQVRQRWGDPIAVRSANGWTYLFFRNGREREVGLYDVVFLQNGQVVDAIVRTPEHVYDGQSSSPEGRAPEFTPPPQPADSTKGPAVTGVRIQPSP
jgi:outer membrane protein assembly factor BamE (lipoprotein component of BamABCDE complex)